MGKVQVCTPPLGFTCAQNIFQWMTDQILECCEVDIGIADKVIIHWKDEEHNQKLHRFISIAHEHGLVFNGEKCEVKQDSVTFFGTVYNADGAHPDPKKVDVVHQMPPPETPSQLQFLGIATYLSIQPITLYTHTTPQQELLEKDSESIWNTSYQEAFDRIRELVCKDMILCYFNIQKPQSPSKSMHQEKDSELHFSRKNVQLPLPLKLLPPLSNVMPTQNVSY